MFSHIIQKRFSHVTEDVATDSLSYLLDSSEASRKGMFRLLRGIIPDLPELRFKTQQADGSIRPDMWGYAGSVPRVFVENKFWAGLTDNQSVSYLKNLAQYSEPTLLIVIAPEAREHTIWRELNRRLSDAGISASECDSPAGIFNVMSTRLGPLLALTSWASVLSALEHEAVNDASARGDIVQLRRLCDAADNEAFAPVTGLELSDQRTPVFILQLSTIVRLAVDAAVSQGILGVAGLRPQASWNRIGRYIWVPEDQAAGAWIGINFDLWKSHGTTPLWLLFEDSKFGRAQEVSHLLEPWAIHNGILTATLNSTFAIGLDVPVGEEKTEVIRSLVDKLGAIGTLLSDLPRRTLLIEESE